MMGYGSLSTAENRSSAANSIPAIITSNHTFRPQIVHIRILNENSPLVRHHHHRRRRRLQIQAESFWNWKIFTLLLILILGVFIGVHLLMLEYTEMEPNHAFHMVDRETLMTDRASPDALNHPKLNSSLVSFVVVLHTQTENCLTFLSCLRLINNMKMAATSSSDLKYNFLIGGDGITYEIRGFNYQSGLEISLMERSIVVGLIGNFTNEEPERLQIAEMEALISESIRREKLQSDYKILGARRHTSIANDGQMMFDILRQFFFKWSGIIISGVY